MPCGPSAPRSPLSPFSPFSPFGTWPGRKSRRSNEPSCTSSLLTAPGAILDGVTALSEIWRVSTAPRAISTRSTDRLRISREPTLLERDGRVRRPAERDEQRKRSEVLATQRVEDLTEHDGSARSVAVSPPILPIKPP